MKGVARVFLIAGGMPGSAASDNAALDCPPAGRAKRWLRLIF